MKKSFISPKLVITRFDLNEEITANLLSLASADNPDGATFDFSTMSLT